MGYCSRLQDRGRLLLLYLNQSDCMESRAGKLQNASQLLLELLLAITLIPSCKNRGIDHLISAADDVMWTKPDSALVLLRKVDTIELKNRSQKARFSLLYSIALDRNYIDTTDPRVIRQAVDYYSHRGPADEKFLTLRYLARIQMNAGEYDKAIVTLSMALDGINDVDDVRMKGFVCSDMAESYLMTYNYSESEVYYDKAIAYFGDANEFENVSLMEINKARVCVSNLDWKEADSLYNKIIGDKDCPQSYRSMAMASYGHMLIICPAPNESLAVNMFENSVRMSGFNSLSLVQKCTYAYALKIVGRDEDSDKIFSVLDKEGKSETPAYKYCKSRVLLANGDFDRAYHLLIESLKDTDEKALRMQNQSSAIIQKNYYQMLSDQRKRELLDLHIEIVCSALALFLMMFFAGIVINRRVKKSKEERQRLVLMKEALDVDLSESRKTAEQMRNDLDVIKRSYFDIYRTQSSWLVQLADVLYSSRKKRTSLTGVRTDVYTWANHIVGEIDNNDDKQHRFEKELDKIYDNIMTCFRTDFKDWEESDIRLFSCFVAQFDAALILMIFDFPSKEAVYMKKQRMKNKIKKGSSDNVDRYLLFL